MYVGGGVLEVKCESRKADVDVAVEILPGSDGRWAMGDE